MKKAQGTTRAKIARHILTYFICLLLAVLTWTLVMYAEYEAKNGKSTPTGAYEETVAVLSESESAVL